MSENNTFELSLEEIERREQAVDRMKRWSRRNMFREEMTRHLGRHDADPNYRVPSVREVMGHARSTFSPRRPENYMETVYGHRRQQG